MPSDSRSAARSPLWRRLRHVGVIAGLPVGVLLLALAIVTGAHNIHGYGDEFSFLGTLALGLLLIANGWRESK